jgi:hypothetical protein
MIPTAGMAALDTILKQCGPCNGPGEQLYVSNVRTRDSLTPGDLDDKALFYSLEYKCCGDK